MPSVIIVTHVDPDSIESFEQCEVGSHRPPDNAGHRLSESDRGASFAPWYDIPSCSVAMEEENQIGRKISKPPFSISSAAFTSCMHGTSRVSRFRSTLATDCPCRCHHSRDIRYQRASTRGNGVRLGVIGRQSRGRCSRLHHFMWCGLMDR